MYAKGFKKPEAKIVIGDNVYLACNVSVITSTHEIGPTDKRCGRSVEKDITIGNGSWIGCNATILSGVTIGDGCVIGAGSLVNKDCEPNSLYVGVPAKKVRSFDE